MSEGDRLGRMLGAYFGRGWSAEGGTAEERLAQMLAEVPVDVQKAAAREIRSLLDGRLCENQIRDVLLYEVGCHYAFERDGLEASSWLRHVHERIVHGLEAESRSRP